MKRREVIRFLLGTVIISPLSARGQTQEPASRLIGFLSSRSARESRDVVAAFHRGLRESGYVEGPRLTVEYRWADGQYDRLPELAAELVRHGLRVLVAVGGEPSALAAKGATSTIPIVFTVGGDPVKIGLVASLNRPGGNATGVSLLTTAPEAKRFGMVRELVPGAALVGVLINPNYQEAEGQSREVNEAAAKLGRQIHILKASTEGGIDDAFATFAQLRAGALLITSDPFFVSRRDQLVALAARYAIPVVYDFREFATSGGLLSYGANLADGYRLVGVYTGKILDGTSPADLPIQQSTKFELVINLKTAKALGVEIPPALFGLADEVID
jgi:putative tryptophan/tyrosine transport system substrate-binding protein